MKPYRFLFLFLWLLALLCFGLVTVKATTSEELNAKTLRQVAEATDEFARLLLMQLERENPGRNVLISPLSLAMTLAMMMGGAGGKTHSEIYTTLGLSKFSNDLATDSSIYQAYHQLNKGLSAPQAALGTSNTTVYNANAMVVQKNLNILESYHQLIDAYFGAELFVEDFTKESGRNFVRNKLNRWVASKTGGKISHLISEASTLTFSPTTIAFALLNANYFKGDWEQKFEVKDTKPGQFHSFNGRSIEVPLMYAKDKFKYAEFANGQLLELPYRNGALSMFIFLPSQQYSNSSISTQFNTLNLALRISLLKKKEVTVYLPRFKLEVEYDSLVDSLRRMGIVDAFDPTRADFSKQTDKPTNLYVSQILQKTIVELDEQGATVEKVIEATPDILEFFPENNVFRADRSFGFFVRDNHNQVTLFEGIVNKPEA